MNGEVFYDCVTEHQDSCGLVEKKPLSRSNSSPRYDFHELCELR